MSDEKEFVAFCRKLLRSLEWLEKALDTGRIDEAKVIVRELKEDTQSDIEA